MIRFVAPCGVTTRNLKSMPSVRNRSGLLLCSILLWVGCDQSKPADDLPKENRPSASSLRDLGVGADFTGGTGASSSAKRPAVVPVFDEVAEASGIRFEFDADIIPKRYYLPEIMGGGIGWLDYDLDGVLDLFAANGGRLLEGQGSERESLDRLYRGRRIGGESRFDDVTAGAAIREPNYGQGIAVGDYDADGFPDLFVANFGRNTLWRNQGDGSFVEVSSEALPGSAEIWSSSCLWTDIDGDGRLDLYVVNYLDVNPTNYRVCQYNGRDGYCGPGSYVGLQDEVWINRGDGTFANRALELGFEKGNGKGLAIVSLDLDQDARAEIYVANDMVANFLFSTRNPFATESQAAAGDSGTAYVELGTLSGTAAGETGQPEASMGIASGDFDGDGWPELFLTHYHSHKNTLYRNRRGLLFTDDSKVTGIARISLPFLGFGTVAFDYDRDRDLDLLVANGHVLGPDHPPELMRPQLLLNDGRGNYSDISDSAGPYFAGEYLGRSVASADYDDDGDLDFAVSHIHRPLALLRNGTATKAEGASTDWVGFEVRSPERRSLVGSRLEVRCGPTTQVLYVAAGGSYLASPDPRLLAGLGDVPPETPVEVTAFWNDGRQERWILSARGRYWRLEPGAEPVDLSALPR